MCEMADETSGEFEMLHSAETRAQQKMYNVIAHFYIHLAHITWL